jgi:hypothetical protein
MTFQYQTVRFSDGDCIMLFLFFRVYHPWQIHPCLKTWSIGRELDSTESECVRLVSNTEQSFSCQKSLLCRTSDVFERYARMIQHFLNNSLVTIWSKGIPKIQIASKPTMLNNFIYTHLNNLMV